jgi:hypothetical protein
MVNSKETKKPAPKKEDVGFFKKSSKSDPAPAPEPKESSVSTSGWQEKGFSSAVAYERYLVKFSIK